MSRHDGRCNHGTGAPDRSTKEAGVIMGLYMEIYDPDDGHLLLCAQVPFSAKQRAAGMSSRMVRRLLAALRMHPLNVRPDGKVCRRAKVRLGWSKPTGGASRREG